MSKKITIPVGKISAVATFGSALAASYLVRKVLRPIETNPLVKILGGAFITGMIQTAAVPKIIEDWMDSSQNITFELKFGGNKEEETKDLVPCPVDFGDECPGVNNCSISITDCNYPEKRLNSYQKEFEEIVPPIRNEKKPIEVFELIERQDDIGTKSLIKDEGIVSK